MKYLWLLFLLPLQLNAQQNNATNIQRWENMAKQVTIIRDNWGIPHVYGNTDAAAVFGLLYAQCEDDFQRVEMNYIEKLGRMAEVKGESSLYDDLLIRLQIDSIDAKNDYAKAPSWLKQLLDAYADGINFYLFKHPDVKPVLLNPFKPWYPLLWTDGSIGAIDIGGVTTNELKNFYGNEHLPTAKIFSENEQLTSGSNGFAFAPSKTASGNAILYINPHVTFYFRPEVQVVSKEGLNAYGAVTWGQFFVYQGFNEHCGWMHTSSYADVADLYAEKVQQQNGKWMYYYNHQWLPVQQKQITIYYSNGSNKIAKTFTTYFTHHGPVMAQRNHQWIAVKAMNRSMNSLIQSWMRTKANNFDEFKKTMELYSNTSNNTVYADDKGNIAYWHGNFMPRRDTAYNWALPVDGTIAATEWKGLHTLNEIIHVYNPATGFIENCNSTPFTVSGSSSPLKQNYPHYMAPDGQNFRGVLAVKLWENATQLTLDKVIKTAYNTHLSAFDILIPALLKAYDLEKNNYPNLEQPIELLQHWNRNASATSVATTLAIEWGQKLLPEIMKNKDEEDEADQVEKTIRFAQQASSVSLLQPLQRVIEQLTQNFGSWQVAWGDINRYQRLTGNVNEIFDDNKPSLPVGFAASTWGCIPSFVSKTFNGTKKRYGYNGNSFICAVEFGKTVKAKSLLTGGESGHVSSPHFTDQAAMYTNGVFKDVLFYKDDVLKHVTKQYHPGE
ncbi:penicillin acylase family protein [Hydrotalea sandarakina]|jgi:acyl-homoserine lactone acylase PvdQ|uniref:Acyl-homoserine lactone acylase PvdQ n=1 Tax=Hydrotalea sandarakina TaxID=1004304 RepID=A0A2W7RPC4_9BACT|nr:penicillin acylase family protein [Hydrotalea sandarakina]PZX60806.1 acyl-homoserine lactone acylase PvdQ [Hydrotalea sandarakina]